MAKRRQSARTSILNLVLDGSTRKKAVGSALRELFATEPNPKLAVSYVSSDITQLLGLPGTAAGTLICDPFGGGCNPEVLGRLNDHDWDVRCLNGLHTKVYLSSTSMAIGSTNLSLNAIDQGNVEAMVIIHESTAVAQAHEWFNRLAASAEPFPDIAKSPERLGQILAAYQARIGRPRVHVGQLQQSIGDFLSGKAFWNSCVFSLMDGADPNDDAALLAAQEIDLPEHWTYDETAIEEDGAAQVRKYKHDADGKYVLGLWVRSTSRDRQRVTAFKSFEGSASKLIGAELSGDTVYCYYETIPEKELPFELEADGGLCAILNRGLERTDKALSVFDYIPGEEMAELYRAGLDADANPAARTRWKLKRKTRS